MTKEETFLRHLSNNPVASAIDIAVVVFKENIKFVALGIGLYTLMILALNPLMDVADQYESHPLMPLVYLFMAIFAILLLSFVISGTIYAGKLIKDAGDYEELKDAIKSIPLKDFYLKWLGVALGHFFALAIYFLPMAIILDNVEKSFMLLIIIVVMALVFIYTYSLIQERVIAATTFKEGFNALFSVFSFSFLRQTFNVEYMIVIFLSAVVMGILSKAFDIPGHLIQYIYTDTSLVYSIVDALFVSLYTILVSIFFTATISILSKEIVDDKSK